MTITAISDICASLAGHLIRLPLEGSSSDAIDAMVEAIDPANEQIDGGAMGDALDRMPAGADRARVEAIICRWLDWDATGRDLAQMLRDGDA